MEKSTKYLNNSISTVLLTNMLKLLKGSHWLKGDLKKAFVTRDMNVQVCCGNT